MSRLPNDTRLIVNPDNTAHLYKPEVRNGAGVCGIRERLGAFRCSLIQAHVYLKPYWCLQCFNHGNPVGP